MDKVVLGHQVTINNSDTLEKAFEGLVLSHLQDIGNSTSDAVDLSNLAEANKILRLYTTIYNKLPFPLCAIEEKIKYASIAQVMRYINNRIVNVKVLDMALIVGVNDKVALYMSGRRWKLIPTVGIEWEGYVDLIDFRSHCAYSEFEWAVRQLTNGKSTAGYYEVYMRELMNACKGSTREFQKQLQDIFKFGEMNKGMVTVQDNSIVDFLGSKQYRLHIYSDGEEKTGRKIQRIVITPGKADTSEIDEVQKIYGFEVLEEPIPTVLNDNDELEVSLGKVTKVEKPGLACLFENMLSDGIEYAPSVKYRGVAYKDTVLYSIEKHLYLAKLSEYVEPDIMSYNAEVVGAYDKYAYYIVRKVLPSGVIRSSLYQIDLSNMISELLTVEFE